ncbi:MAG: hypothetical protein LBG21_05670 [Campylobacteraceae bacterium]|jgi:hypothetical protein|nr:hypothetical protein [Campylobacteraceae bacterium]
MENVEQKIICECANRTIKEAIEIFCQTDPNLPYKKAKKSVTLCGKSCCITPLMALFKMVKEKSIDYDKISFLIDERDKWLKAQ